MKISRISIITVLAQSLLLCGCAHNIDQAQPEITLATLMDEMTDIQAIPCYPTSAYKARQLTSYDRRSVIPNTPSWHSNDDWGGFIRYEADGEGSVVMRFVMPYKKSATVELQNISSYTADATISACVSSWKWNENTLYFHATWRQQNALPTNEGIDYDMATLKGRGVFVADVLSLYNYSPKWYGEGDEHIWVDGDTFPSHFGCGTEDYYNTTYAPIHVYHFPFGGAPREDDEASRGYNTFVRTRSLDAIPFEEKLKFEFELISWEGGPVDYSSTVYWYGDISSQALTPSPSEDALYVLPSAIMTGD